MLPWLEPVVQVRRTLFKTPHTLETFTQVTTVSCGKDFTACLDDSGNVWTFGHNNYGQLGCGGGVNTHLTPFKIPELPCITDIKCGSEHLVLLDEESSLWGTGRNNQGQLGLGTTPLSSTPCILPNIENVEFISCGLYNTFAITKQGDLFACGLNRNNQLGINNTNDITSFVNTKLKDIVSVASGDEHTLFLDSNFKVFGCGRNYCGQLGLGEVHQVNTPTKLENIEVKQISCGYFHSLFVDLDGNLFVSGKVANDTILGRFFISAEKDTSLVVPTKLEGPESVISMSSGGKHVIVKDAFNHIWCFGENGYGKLGLGDGYDSKVPEPTCMPEDQSQIIGFRSKAKSARKA